VDIRMERQLMVMRAWNRRGTKGKGAHSHSRRKLLCALARTPMALALSVRWLSKTEAARANGHASKERHIKKSRTAPKSPKASVVKKEKACSVMLPKKGGFGHTRVRSPSGR